MITNMNCIKAPQNYRQILIGKLKQPTDKKTYKNQEMGKQGRY